MAPTNKRNRSNVARKASSKRTGKSPESKTVATEKTGEKQGSGGARRPPKETQFKPGQSGNPAGRPKGSRNKFGQDFIETMAADFNRHGSAAIEEVRKNRPQDYLKVAASLVPKGIDVDVEAQGCLWVSFTEIGE